MEVPRNVTHRIEIFRKNGYVWPDKVNLFRIDSWLQVMMGQGVFPESHHRATRIPGTASLQQTLDQIRANVASNLAQMPDHQAFIDRYCPIPDELDHRASRRSQTDQHRHRRWRLGRLDDGCGLVERVLPGCRITLIESEEIGIVGVGEATIPPIKQFNQMLGLDEFEFIRRTKGSYKLGIQFVDWVEPGRRYFHPFGTYGRPFDFGHLMYFWHQAQRLGKVSSSLDDYCMAWVVASQARFAVPLTDPRSVLSTYDYAYHFDASLYAAFLREVSERRGVVRIEGRIVASRLNGESGHVESLQLAGRARSAGRTVHRLLRLSRTVDRRSAPYRL